MPLQLTITGDTPKELVGEMLRAISAFKGVEFTPAAAQTAVDPPAVAEVEAPAADVAPASAAVEKAPSEAPSATPPAAEMSPSAPVADAQPEIPAFLDRNGAKLQTEPTKDNVSAWLDRVAKTKNFEVAREVVKSFDAKRISEVKEADYGKFIEACQKVLGA